MKNKSLNLKCLPLGPLYGNTMCSYYERDFSEEFIEKNHQNQMTNKLSTYK